jgi:hypothetical protein
MGESKLELETAKPTLLAHHLSLSLSLPHVSVVSSVEYNALTTIRLCGPAPSDGLQGSYDLLHLNKEQTRIHRPSTPRSISLFVTL